MFRISGAHLEHSPPFRRDARSLHQASYMIARALYSTGSQFSMNAWGAIRTSAPPEHRTDLLGQLLVGRFSWAGR